VHGLATAKAARNINQGIEAAKFSDDLSIHTLHKLLIGQVKRLTGKLGRQIGCKSNAQPFQRFRAVARHRHACASGEKRLHHGTAKRAGATRDNGHFSPKVHNPVLSASSLQGKKPGGAIKRSAWPGISMRSGVAAY
jgi:hypothetical protein